MENVLDDKEHIEEHAVVESAQPKLKEPSMFKVMMHNDDFTPMEVVVKILELFFNMDTTQATAIMFEIHTKGLAICGTYSKDVAETKAQQVTLYARQNDHPLLCTVEET